MKKPVVDYREFRLSRLTDPRFNHLLLLLGWVGYFIMYFVTERFIPVTDCYVVHSPVDDMIPFCEIFVIPYVMWYVWIVATLLYFMFYNTDNFKNLMKFIIITQIVAMAVYIIFPNMQDLRPAEFERDNVFTKVVGILYTVDTNTNVCPSLHVAYSLGLASVWLKERSATPVVKVMMVVMAVLVCMSTMFIKQHSFIDFLAALPLGLLAEIIVFGKSYYLSKIHKNPDNAQT